MLQVKFVAHLVHKYGQGKDVAMVQKNDDSQQIKELIQIMNDNDLVEIEIKHGDDKILLKRAQAQQPGVTAVPMSIPSPAAAAAAFGTATQAAAEASAKKEELVEIKSPIVGTFYAASSPDSEPLVEIGTHIESQTVVCIIEAMKVMNEIKAETTGIVEKVMVSTGQAVEFGQVLFKIRPD